MKEKVLKIIYKISFLPYIGILIFGIYGAFFGTATGFFGDQTLTYGFDAFWTVVVFSTMALLMTGVIPFCIIYQLFYKAHNSRKKKKIKEEEVDS